MEVGLPAILGNDDRTDQPTERPTTNRQVGLPALLGQTNRLSIQPSEQPTNQQTDITRGHREVTLPIERLVDTAREIESEKKVQKWNGEREREREKTGLTIHVGRQMMHNVWLKSTLYRSAVEAPLVPAAEDPLATAAAAGSCWRWDWAAASCCAEPANHLLLLHLGKQDLVVRLKSKLLYYRNHFSNYLLCH